MKELTTEQKAKAYDEALSVARKTRQTQPMYRDWLEKMFPELEDSEDERMVQYFKDLAPFDKADELYEKYGFSHKDAIAWLEAQGEKSAEWGEEDKMQLDAAIYLVSSTGHIETANWLKSLKDRVQPQPQPKQGWSEEDERIKNNLLSELTNLSVRKLIEKETEKKYASWIKSLRPQSTWKPSREQIIALRWFLNNVPYNKHKEEISGLIEQIKDFV